MTQEVDILLETGDRTCGELLRMAREKKGFSIEQVEDALKIKAKHIEAIEYDDHDDLPGRVYAIGFIRTYSEYMGFDADKMVELFKMKGIGRHSTIDLSAYSEVITVSQTPSTPLILFCVLALCAFGFIAGKINKPYDQQPIYNDIQEVPKKLISELEGNLTITYKEVDSISKEPTKLKIVKETAKPATEPRIDTSGNKITIKAIYDSWIQVRDNKGKSVYSGILQMGRTYEVPNNSGHTLMTGNAGGTEIIIGKKSIGVLGRSSQVKKNIRLNSNSLLSKQ